MSKTNDKYWDCECEENFIHKKSEVNFCSMCQVYAHNQPDSMETEVEELLKKKTSGIREQYEKDNPQLMKAAEQIAAHTVMSINYFASQGLLEDRPYMAKSLLEEVVTILENKI